VVQDLLEPLYRVFQISGEKSKHKRDETRDPKIYQATACMASSIPAILEHFLTLKN